MKLKNMIVSTYLHLIGSATSTWFCLKDCLKLLTVPYQTFFMDDIGFYIVFGSLDEQVHRTARYLPFLLWVRVYLVARPVQGGPCKRKMVLLS